MHWSDLPWNPTPRMLRQFAGLLLIFASLLAARAWFASEHTHTRALLPIVTSIALTAIALIGLAAPRAIRPLFIAWLAAAFPIGWLVSRLILAALFICVVTPIALLFRWRGRDALQLRRPKTDSYWLPKPPATDAASYFRQY